MKPEDKTPPGAPPRSDSATDSTGSGAPSPPAKRKLMGSPEPSSASKKAKPEPVEVIDVDADDKVTPDADADAEVTPEAEVEPSEATINVATVLVAFICVMTRRIRDSFVRGALRDAASKGAKIYLNEEGTELAGSMPLPKDTEGWNIVFNIIRLLTNMEVGTVTSFQEYLERSAENGVVSSPIRTVARALTNSFGDISILTLSQVWVRVSDNVYCKGDLHDMATMAESFCSMAAWSVKAPKKVRPGEEAKAEKVVERQQRSKSFFEKVAALIPSELSEKTEGSAYLIETVFNTNARSDQRMLSPKQLNLNVQTPHAISYILAVYGRLHRTMAKAICAGLEWNSQQEGEEGKDHLARTVFTLIVNVLYKYAHKKGWEQIDNDFVFNAIYELLEKVKKGDEPDHKAIQALSALLKCGDRWELKVSTAFPLGIPRQANASSHSDSPVPEQQPAESDAESDYDVFSSDEEASDEEEAPAAEKEQQQDEDGNASTDEDEDEILGTQAH